MVKFNFSDFKSCKSEPPTADGEYLVLGIYKGKVTYCSRLEYHTEYGWNVSKLMDGTWYTKNEIVFEDDDHFWAIVTVVEDDTNVNNSND